MGSYRTEVELEFAGDYTGLCASQSYLDMQSFAQSRGGIIEDCEADNQGYRVIAGLVTLTGFNNSLVTSVYAQECSRGEICTADVRKGFCINSNNKSVSVDISEAVSLPSPFCTSDEVGIVGPFNWVCVEPSCYDSQSNQVSDTYCADSEGNIPSACGI